MAMTKNSSVAAVVNPATPPAQAAVKPLLRCPPAAPERVIYRGVVEQESTMCEGLDVSSLGQTAIPALQRHFHRIRNKRIRKRCE